MVCSLGRGRMAVMARLLGAESFSQTIADDFGHENSVAEYICRELREADEPNLLDEGDMHVFGEKPMTDPLQLVCCNACKKPIKDSQFAAHAELCRSLKLTRKTSLELDSNMGNQKPPRKEKIKSSTSFANQATVVREQRRSEYMDTIDTDVPQSSQITVACFPSEAKGYSSCIDAVPMMDGTGISPENRDHPASVMHPPTKRHKKTASTHLALLESHGTESGVTNTVSFTDGNHGITCRDFLERTVSDHGDPKHRNPGPCPNPKQLLMTNDFPAPIATKIYYSQRSNRLRAALCHLYFQDISKKLCSDIASPKISNAEMVAFQDSCQRDPSIEQVDNMPNKESHLPTLCSSQNLGQVATKSSEICLLKAGSLPSGNSSDQFLGNDVSRSAAAHVGLTKSNFLPKSYSYASKTGNMLGTIQQPHGSVPVI